jgi:hypothetical protein
MCIAHSSACPNVPEADPSAVTGCLQLVQVRVVATALHQLSVGPVFDDSAVGQNDDQVRGRDGREAVCDQQGDAAASLAAPPGRGVPVEQCVFGGGIERGCRLVQDEQQRRGPHHPPRDGNALPLAARQPDASWPRRAQLGVETLWERVEYVGG